MDSTTIDTLVKLAFLAAGLLGCLYCLRNRNHSVATYKNRHR